MSKRRRPDNTMSKRRRPDNTMSKRRRTDNTMAKRQKNRQYNGQKTEEQTIQWPKGKNTNNDLQNILIKLKIE
jgi:hypothetical protein